MAQRLLSKALAVGLIAGAVMSAGGVALAEDNDPPPGGKGCLVEIVNDHGETIGYEVVPEGTVISLFHCAGGEWRFGWFPFDALVSGGTGQISTDGKGSVKDAVLDVDTREGDLQVREMQAVVETLFEERVQAPGKAAVVTFTDRRDELSAQEYAALLEGKDVRGVKVLALTDPRPDETINDLNDGGGAGGGGVMERKVVVRLSKNWIFVGDVTCTTNKDGTKTCTIKGTIKRG